MKKTNVYPNIEAEMSRHGFTRKILGEKLGLTESAVSQKLIGKNGFSAMQAFALHDILNFKGTTKELLEKRKA